MEKRGFKAVKKRMGQIWNEAEVVPVTYLVLKEASEIVLAVNDRVKITGVTKGRGFAGVVKRHGFAGGPKTHGQSDRWRHAGSMGQTTTPGRVYKGKRMAGRMGGDRASLRTTIIEVREDNKTLVVKGPVPGSIGQPVLIKKI